jgi:hypothetical protein
MSARVLRTALRKVGLRVPFGGVICPEIRKTIFIEGDWRARVNTQRTLVFTDEPCPGDLRDRFPIEAGTAVEALFYDSPDAQEVARHLANPQTLVIAWMPKQPITRYALYQHVDTWNHPESHERAAIAAHFDCREKVGTFTIEFITPGTFEAGVMFRRPRWRRLRTERALIKYALAQMRVDGAIKPRLDETASGRRAIFEISGPRIGECFLFVLFHAHGVVEWERRLYESSLRGRLEKLVPSRRGA